MANKIEVVIQHALRTFSKRIKKVPECSPTEISELKALTDDLTVTDINTLGKLSQTNELKKFLKRSKTALDYLSVYEDESISVGVFLLQQGAKLPIHDHPNMFGIIKVLEGILKITSYSVTGVDNSSMTSDNTMFYKQPLKVVKHPQVLVSNKDQSCLLTPSEKNIHEVECITGPAAFLDILSPPYEDGDSNTPRACHYFEELNDETEAVELEDSDIYLRLKQVPNPF